MGRGNRKDGFVVYLLRMPGVHFRTLLPMVMRTLFLVLEFIDLMEQVGFRGSACGSHCLFFSLFLFFFFHLHTALGSLSFCLPLSSSPPLSLLPNVFLKPSCPL